MASDAQRPKKRPVILAFLISKGLYGCPGIGVRFGLFARPPSEKLGSVGC